MFIRKAAGARLPAASNLGQPPILRTVDPTQGWLIDRWHKDALPTAPAAPYCQYRGDRSQAFWCFDEEMATATEQYYQRTWEEAATHRLHSRG